MSLSREEINALIDQKIKEHEWRIGLISGLAGIFLLPLLLYLIVLCLLRVML